MCDRHNSSTEHVCTVNVAANVHQTLEELEFEKGVWHASQTGDLKRVIKLVIDRRQDANRTDSAGYTALHYAARNGHLEICKFLIENGANIDAATRAGRATPLHRACTAGHLNVVRYFIEEGADLKAIDSDGKNCLHRAMASGNAEICKLLTVSEPKLDEQTDYHGKLPKDYV